MPFTFELSFTGLCLFTFEGNPVEPELPTLANVLLLDARKNGNGAAPDTAVHVHGQANGRGKSKHIDHLPLLTYALRDLTNRSPKRGQTIFPGPAGEPIARRELGGLMNLKVVPPGAPALRAVWRPAERPLEQVPRGPEEEPWLDWSLGIRKLLPELAATPTSGAPAGLQRARITAQVQLTGGTLQSSRVVRGLNGGYLLWHFVGPDGDFDPRESQAIADIIVLRLEGLTKPVRIDGFNEGPVEFAPPAGTTQDLVRVSITNLPPEEIDDEGEQLVHVADHYSQLVSERFRERLRRPTNSDHLDTPSSTACPPTT